MNDEPTFEEMEEVYRKKTTLHGVTVFCLLFSCAFFDVRTLVPQAPEWINLIVACGFGLIVSWHLWEGLKFEWILREMEDE